jgi:hypothetical protein
MGVHLAIYAIDLPRFEQVLEQSLADLLWLHQRTAIATGSVNVLRWIESDEHCTTHSSIQGKGVTSPFTDATGARVYRILTEEETHRIPFLQQSARAFLNGNSPFSLKFLLQGLSECDGMDCIQCLTEGDRRWWVGSALYQAREVLKIDEGDCQRLGRIFGKIIGHWQCGYPLPEADHTNDLAGFPVVPEPDPDLRVGSWTKEEALEVADVAERLLACEKRFVAPLESQVCIPRAMSATLGSARSFAACPEFARCPTST